MNLKSLTIIDFESIDGYATTGADPRGIPHETVCREAMGRKQKDQLQVYLL